MPPTNSGLCPDHSRPDVRLDVFGLYRVELLALELAFALANVRSWSGATLTSSPTHCRDRDVEGRLGVKILAVGTSQRCVQAIFHRVA